mmetsp:Transcript_43250/g.90883  ORF Transcript_43250/g.90883 Transcript_43250/m.90883 type:complete len:177 (+) Transcript_43250:1052-1582(+)
MESCEKEAMVMPWIDLKKLQAMHGGGRNSQYFNVHGNRSFRQKEEEQEQRNHHHHRDTHQSKYSDPSVLERWSHQPPDYKRPHSLQRILVTVPETFPPTNTKVEHHDYFEKWKTFDKEAFEDESGDELKELLKRAVRKAKFFLHPDKLPNDLTENQREVFETLWNVIQDAEAKLLK